MNSYPIPDYYFDNTLTEQEKMRLDLEMIAADFPIPTHHDNK